MLDKMVKMLMAGLKFSGTEIGDIAKDESYTQPAIWLLSISVLLNTVIAFFRGNSGSSGVGRMGLTGSSAAIAEFGSAVVGLFLSALIMVYVIRIFKVKLPYNGILRVYGSAIVWTILLSLLLLVLPHGILRMIVAIGFWLAYNFAEWFGLTKYANIEMWKTFVSIVLTFLIIFIIMMPYGTIIGALFA